MREPDQQAYFVCATPRSGSTLFCEALTATGVAGRPAEYFEALRGTDLPRQPHEYFDLPDAELEALLPRVEQHPAAELAAATDYLDYVAWAREQGTDNGVFAAKLMWGYLGEFTARLRDTGRHAGDDLAVLRSAFPAAKFVRVVRLSKVDQAVSLWTAIQTQSWRADDDGGRRATRDPVYSHRAIAHLVRYLTAHEDQWSTFFARGGVTPHAVLYEELVENWDETLRRTLHALEVPGADELKLPDPPLKRQSDGRSSAWVERFVSEERSALRTA